MGPEIGNGNISLFLDVDGTLIDIAARPEQVVVPAALVDALDRIDRTLDGAIALVSGRTIANLDALFRPLRLSASGVHGAEVRFEPSGPIHHLDDAVLGPGLVQSIENLAAEVEGTMVENKRFSVALHYRQVPEAGPFLKASLEAIVAGERDNLLRILPGHMVFEVKRATFDKGLAVERFMARPPFAGRTPVFIGDDVTDRPGFRAAVERGGQAFSVGAPIPGTSGSFPDPAAVRTWLAGLQAETSQA